MVIVRLRFRVRFSKPLDDNFGLGAPANRPPEAGAEAAELDVEDSQHCRVMGVVENWLNPS